MKDLLSTIIVIVGVIIGCIGIVMFIVKVMSSFLHILPYIIGLVVIIAVISYFLSPSDKSR
ncbi:hypothetical protein [Dysgonomonas sp. ZJ279]|uniref:hypothetical protein n=1 Tax=Dysgonomonas sp. ZJ279 TaxID=2709796 RepID=UPI0013EE2080|nr:hypothetical protein [Dysgonomonas sp. ZJ279]